MNSFALLVFAVFLAGKVYAQENLPVRLAIVPESPESGSLVDLLTARLSNNSQVQLLERAEIDRVYHEQGLSSINHDDLRLGQILGADGLIFIGTTDSETNHTLYLRLVAVKPGAVVFAKRVPWPMDDPADLASVRTVRMQRLLPKLKVEAGQAIPISLVNMRSALQSEDSIDAERELRVLTVEGLSAEPRLFTLERQRMEALEEEKYLKADNSAFWNGSYLLDGIIDAHGYSPTTITINARLVPPNGRPSTEIEVSGSRTNLAMVSDLLAAKVVQAVENQTNVYTWKRADEAKEYLAEAQWALRWNLYSEAQAAADAAWALGQHDEECAIARVKAYEEGNGAIAIAEDGIIDRSIIDSAQSSERNSVIRDAKDSDTKNAGATFEFILSGLHSVAIANAPDSRHLANVIRATEMYRAYSENLPVQDLKPNSDWLQLGLEALEAAGYTLQHFYLVSRSRVGCEDQLADLRTTARWINHWILQSSAVAATYSNPGPNAEQNRRALLDQPNIFHCELDWGCFWQERPEDCIALYRGLLNSPAFAYFTESVGGAPTAMSRDLVRPFLTAWNIQDRARIQTVWENFIQELASSTNALLSKQADTFKKINTPAGLNEEEVVTAYSKYWWDIQAAKQEASTGQQQPERDDLTSDINDLMSSDMTNSKPLAALALKIRPRLDSFKKNLVQKTQSTTGPERQSLLVEVQYTALVQNILNQTNQHSPEMSNASISTSEPKLTPKDTNVSVASTDGDFTNGLLVENFLPVPIRDFQSIQGTQTVRIMESRWCDGKLVLNLSLGKIPSGRSSQGFALAIFNPATGNWETILYPENTNAAVPVQFGSPVFFHGALFAVQTDGTIGAGNAVESKEQFLEYTPSARQWRSLPIHTAPFMSLHDGTQLWVVDNHLYGANSSSIFEIVNEGEQLRLLASARRRPAVSSLDLLDYYGSPKLFSRSNQTLRLAIEPKKPDQEGIKLYSWDGKDWRKLFGLRTAQSDAFDDAMVFRDYPTWDFAKFPTKAWFLSPTRDAPELAIFEEATNSRARELPGWRTGEPDNRPLWKLAKFYPLASSNWAYSKSRLFIYFDRTKTGHLPNGKPTPIRTAIDGDLICLEEGNPQPIVVPLKFDASRGPAPWASNWPDLKPIWITFSPKFLIIGNCDAPGIWAVPISKFEEALAKQKSTLSGM